MHQPQGFRTWVLVLVATLYIGTAFGSTRNRLVTVSRANICVTEGILGELPGQQLSVDVPKMRAYLNEITPQAIEAHFTYLGPTENQTPLGSGEVRRQFGLKLRAQDACNLVYAMWRIAPESKLVVSVKSNPGQHTSAECGNRGYLNIKPSRSTLLPVLRSGDTHDLRAEMNGADLKVYADDSPVWEGSVGSAAVTFDGPVGIRSDNARLQIELRAGESQPGHAPGCRSGENESE